MLPPDRRTAVRHAMVVPIAVLLGGLGGYAVHSRQAPVYEARSSVLVVAPLESAGGAGRGGEVRIETEAQLLHSAQVAADASEALEGEVSPEALLAGSSVSIPPNSQVLTVTSRAGDPARARDAARALAEAYIRRRESLAAAERDAVVASLEEQLAGLSTRLQDTASALASTPQDSLAQIELLEAQRDLVVDQVADINNRLVSLRVQSTAGGQVITAAREPDGPVSPVLAVNVGAGVVLGGLLGGGLLLLLDRRRGGTAARGGAVEVPVLELGAIADAGTARGGDAGRALRRALGDAGATGGPVVVVAADPHDGDPDDAVAVTLGLAGALASQDGTGVAVLPRPGSHADLAPSVRPGTGLRDVLAGRASVQDALVRPPGGPTVLGPGHDVGDDALAAHDRLSAVWTLLGGRFDAIVVHADASGAAADAIVRTAGRVVVATSGPADAGVARVLGRLQRLDVADRLACVIAVDRPSTGIDGGPRPGEPSPGALGRDLAEVVGERD